jgi:hypothetical protein
MEDGNFWHLGDVTRWNSQFLIHTWIFFSSSFLLLHNCSFVCFEQVYGLRIGVYNTYCFKNLCKIAQASKISGSNAQHFLLDLLTHSWFHFMLFALPSYQFPYILMNRCLHLISYRCLNLSPVYLTQSHRATGYESWLEGGISGKIVTKYKNINEIFMMILLGSASSQFMYLWLPHQADNLCVIIFHFLRVVCKVDLPYWTLNRPTSDQSSHCW